MSAIKVLGVLFAGVVLVGGIIGMVMQDEQKAKAVADRSLAEQQIAKYKLSPAMFQLRCGDATYRKHEQRGFVLSYPKQNVSVSFLADSKNPNDYTRVDYFSMQPLVPITLSEVVQRLDCSPRAD
jgi:hypothetical protein